ncbi:MAG: hypothetical protein ACRDSE_13040 [Pseudonocardiaceae bacterium]
MLRYRTIAGSPLRSATATWTTISTLVADTLDRSPVISRDAVEKVFETATGLGRQLVAGGHLEGHDLVVVAAPVHLAIRTASGAAAINLDENLNPVPGGASATEWMVYLPTPDPVGQTVRELADRVAHLSAEPAPTNAATPAAPTNGHGAAIDLTAVARRLSGAR